MPALGESVTEGTVTRWLKAVGDEVTADEPLLEVSTDKVDTEIPAPVSGTLLSITVNEDETVDVGAELAIIGTGSAGGGTAAPAQEAPAEEPKGGPEAGGTRRAAEAGGPEAGGAGRGAEAGGPPAAAAPSAARRAATAAARTSRRWCAGWPPTAAST